MVRSHPHRSTTSAATPCCSPKPHRRRPIRASSLSTSMSNPSTRVSRCANPHRRRTCPRSSAGGNGDCSCAVTGRRPPGTAGAPPSGGNDSPAGSSGTSATPPPARSPAGSCAPGSSPTPTGSSSSPRPHRQVLCAGFRSPAPADSGTWRRRPGSSATTPAHRPTSLPVWTGSANAECWSISTSTTYHHRRYGRRSFPPPCPRATGDV